MLFKSISRVAVILAATLVSGFVSSAVPQDMKNMPGMKMGKSNSQKKRMASRKKPAVKRHNMANMPGMNMPGMKMSNTHRMRHRRRRSRARSTMKARMQNMPGMTMPGMNMPGMNMNMGPLMVMNGNEMAVRVGSSDKNLISMGALGSGTSWQPSSGPMHMHYKVAGDWLLMFHYNLIVAMNRQGGLRGVTKLDSANWFMPMAYHKIGRGTLQLRGMFSAEPFTFPPGGSPL